MFKILHERKRLSKSYFNIVIIQRRQIGQFINTGGSDFLQPSKAHQQPLAPLGANALDILQRRPGTCLAALFAMSLYGESVCFVPNLLDQVQFIQPPLLQTVMGR